MLAYTFAQLKAAAEHALGGVPDSRISSGLIVNRAINHLVNAHPWPWRVILTTLSYTAAQDYIELPADFGEIVTLQANGGRYTSVRAMSAEAFLNARNVGTAGGGLFLGYYIGIGPQTVTTTVPRWRLNLFPTPAASEAGNLTLLYRKLIPVMATTGTADDAKVPAIPIGQHDTLYALCRAFAVSMEENPATQEWQLALGALKRDMDAAGRAEDPIVGLMRNTGVDNYMAGGSCGRPHREISDADMNP